MDGDGLTLPLEICFSIELRRPTAEALARSADDGTMSKSEANYRKKDGAESCGGCEMFDDGTCSIVRGSIDPNYVCDHYEEK